MGESEAPGGAWDWFFIENPRRGGGVARSRRGREGVCGELGILGGGGAKYFSFRGRNVHQEMGFRTEIHTRHVEFALKFALGTSILIALSKTIPQKALSKQGKCRLDGESAV